MRDIKFRAWDKESRSMLDVQSLDWFMHENIEEEYEVMQYTGLKDKNGKEIYEGDIIQWGEYTEPVRVEEETSNWSIGDFYLSVAKEGEVIGNIYENPELINGDKTKGDK